jgi:hypothetical protein
MARVVDARPMGFLDLWYPSVVEVVAGRGDFEVEVVGAGGGECDCAVAMAVVEVVDWGIWLCDGASRPWWRRISRLYSISVSLARSLLMFCL